MHPRSRHVLRLCLPVCLLLAGSGGCENQPQADRWEGKSTQTIIGGETETGYPAVGSIFFKEWLQSQSKCTATLIKPDWILTAAHCLKNGLSNLSFSIGPDAKQGTKYSLAEYVVHPRYDSNPIGSLYDIALVRLTKPVPANVATPFAYSRTPLDPYLGEPVLYVGYGSTSGTSSFLGVGRKRRLELPIDRIDPVTYSNAFNGTSLCFGDSGGPGLLEIGGQLQIVGVNSASLGCQGGTCDPCTNGSKQTRVDRFADWIASHVGDSFTSCSDDIARCLCPAACEADGICDHALCGTHSCGDITGCIFGECADTTDGSCSTACIDDGSLEGRAQLRVLVDCWAKECRKVPGSASERECLMTNCSVEWDACEAQAPGTQPDGGTAPDAAGVPDSAGQPDSASEPDSAGQPDSASEPDSAGQPDSASEPDSAGQPDAAGNDASTGADAPDNPDDAASPDAGSDTDPTDPEKTSTGFAPSEPADGCSCRLAPSRFSPRGVLFALGLLAVFLRRQTKRGTRPEPRPARR